MSKKIGGLWTKKDKTGKTYLSGSIEVVAGLPTRIAVFRNDKKEGKQPDWNIVIQTPGAEQAKKPESQNNDLE